MWNTFKPTNTCVMGISGEERKVEKKILVKERMAGNFPNLMKNINLHRSELNELQVEETKRVSHTDM